MVAVELAFVELIPNVTAKAAESQGVVVSIVPHHQTVVNGLHEQFQGFVAAVVDRRQQARLQVQRRFKHAAVVTAIAKIHQDRASRTSAIEESVDVPDHSVQRFRKRTVAVVERSTSKCRCNLALQVFTKAFHTVSFFFSQQTLEDRSHHGSKRLNTPFLQLAIAFKELEKQI